MEIRQISAREAQPLRARILRPNVEFQASVYPLDEAEESLHMGAFEGEELVSVASIFHESQPGEDDEGEWRLRGMVTLPYKQRRGYGRAVLEKCVEEIGSRGAKVLWCNARIDAVEFYRKLGFETVGGEQRTSRGTSFIRMKRPIEGA